MPPLLLPRPTPRLPLPAGLSIFTLPTRRPALLLVVPPPCVRTASRWTGLFSVWPAPTWRLFDFTLFVVTRSLPLIFSAAEAVLARPRPASTNKLAAKLFFTLHHIRKSPQDSKWNKPRWLIPYFAERNRGEFVTSPR